MPSSTALALAVVTGSLLSGGLAFLAGLRACRANRRPDALRQAAAQAREQFGRDVHDLVGSRLWLASLQGELAYRLADEDSPVRPALAGVIESVRQAAADIRNVTRSYQGISLWAEAADSRAVLTARGMHCVLDLEHVDLAPEVDAAFAVMVREAVANMLRHSRPRRCHITLRITVRSEGRSALLTVANDGANPQAAPSEDGHGIANLRDRAAALNGTLDASAGPDGWFRLVAELPVRAPR
ncbi:hypothetical protein Pth03_01140 [Planotetraspora thailandica]|uniref:Signal transduction histidine kinase subgroup 3 dimerisation and phosphoacceptor domain-containing protein n=1 Tax=Planotetraspora thailandica TaxID=487172 RepID=A0A8J3XT22_9ACTN|nr:histidine kinase [Planotetraspora thailandica]GII51725.1 hypothetical protein Pth03_01140 [Planotetraspora thailandica]